MRRDYFGNLFYPDINENSKKIMSGKLNEEELTRQLEEQTESVIYYKASTEEEKKTTRLLKGDQRKEMTVMSPNNRFKEVKVVKMAPSEIKDQPDIKSAPERKSVSRKNKITTTIKQKEPFVVNGVVLDGRDWKHMNSPTSSSKRSKIMNSDNSCPVLADILMVQEQSSIAKSHQDDDNFVEDMSELKASIHEYNNSPVLKSKKSSPIELYKIEPELPKESILKRSPRRTFVY